MFFRPLRLAILWSVFILILCGFPGNHIPKLTFLQWLKPDKLVHLVIFGIQCWLLIWGFSRQQKYLKLKNNPVMPALILTISYGALVEILQSLIFIQRSGDIRDAIANALGALLGWLLYRRYGKSLIQA
jgi:glycopeptide antibiotics resistance protein